MPILIAISRIYRRCNWSPAAIRPRMSRGKRCAFGGGLLRIGQPVGRAVVYDIYAYAKAIEAENRVSFAESFTRAFGEVVPRLNDTDAYAVTRWLETSPQVFQSALQRALDQQRAKDSIDQSDAVKLIWTYLSFDAYRSFGPLVDALVAADDDRRYTVDNEVLIKASDGANIAAVVARPKSRSEPLATLLEVTIDDSQKLRQGMCGTRLRGGGGVHPRNANESPPCRSL